MTDPYLPVAGRYGPERPRRGWVASLTILAAAALGLLLLITGGKP